VSALWAEARADRRKQLFLFAAQIIAASLAKATEPTATGAEEKAGASGATSPTQPKGHGRKSLPASLERRRVVFDLEEAQRQCPHCQTRMQRIGEDISERLEVVPASLQVSEEVRPKYACAQGCVVAVATKPAVAIEKGLPGPGAATALRMAAQSLHRSQSYLGHFIAGCGLNSELPRRSPPRPTNWRASSITW
jgi:hypothetical protein